MPAAISSVGCSAGFGISRGVTGGVRMIDAARALPLLRTAAESWEWRTPDAELAPWIGKAVARFTEWDNLIDAQIALLTSQLSQTAVIFCRKVHEPAIPSTRLDAAVTAATAAGHAPDDLEQFRGNDQERGGPGLAHGGPTGERSGQGEAQPGPAGPRPTARIIAAVRDRGADLSVILDFLARSDQWLTEALAAAAMREGGAGIAAAAQVQDLLRQWAEVAGRRSQD